MHCTRIKELLQSYHETINISELDVCHSLYMSVQSPVVGQRQRNMHEHWARYKQAEIHLAPRGAGLSCTQRGTALHLHRTIAGKGRFHEHD